jgi:hypothetical protein
LSEHCSFSKFGFYFYIYLENQLTFIFMSFSVFYLHFIVSLSCSFFFNYFLLSTLKSLDSNLPTGDQKCETEEVRLV